MAGQGVGKQLASLAPPEKENPIRPCGMDEHRSHQNRNNPEGSGMARHAIEEDHTPEWNQTEIVFKSKSKWERRLVESFKRHDLGDLALAKNTPVTLTPSQTQIYNTYRMLNL